MIRRFFHGLSPVGHGCEEKLRWTWRERKGKQKSSSSSKPWLGRTAAAWILHRCRCWRRGPGRCTTAQQMRSNGSQSDLTNTSIWLHYSISTWGPLQTLKKSSKCALHWDSDAFHGCTGWPGVKGNRKPSKTSAKMCQEPRSSRLRRLHEEEYTKETISIHPQWPKTWYQNTADSNSK